MNSCPDFIPKPRSSEEMADDFARTMSIINEHYCHAFNNLQYEIEHIPTVEERIARIETGHEYFWEACRFLVKYFGEMSKDDFEKFQTQYREQIRQDSEGSNKPSDTDCEKGSGESNENVFVKGDGSNV